MSPLRLVVSPEASRDVDEIAIRISSDKPLAALRWLDRVGDRFKTLCDCPGIGTARDDVGVRLRSVPFGDYLVFFREGEATLEIVRVIDGHRDFRRRL